MSSSVGFAGGEIRERATAAWVKRDLRWSVGVSTSSTIVERGSTGGAVSAARETRVGARRANWVSVKVRRMALGDMETTAARCSRVAVRMRSALAMIDSVS